MILAAVAAAAISLGVILPDSGIDGADGIRMRDAVALAVADERAHGFVALWGTERRPGVRNPHQDEGSDNGADAATAPHLIRTLAAAGARAIVGPLRSNVAVAILDALRQTGMVAITPSALSPDPLHPHIFRLAPSERQRAALADATMRREFGPRICVLDDGTQTGRLRASALTSVDPSAHHLSILSLGPNPFVTACVANADGVYLAGEGAEPIFAARATVRKATPQHVVAALSRRDFDAEQFGGAGAFFRVDAVPLARTSALAEVANRYRARNHVAPDDDVLRAYAATQIAAQVTRIAGHRDIAAQMRGRSFATILGDFRFDDRGDPVRPSVAVKRLTP